MKKVLIIVDVQNDFLERGSLAVAGGSSIINNINKLSESGIFDVVIATQDYHPENHCSFASSYPNTKPFDIVNDDMVWPDHCIAGTKGSELSPLLTQAYINTIFRKGMNKNVDSYSAFSENDKVTETGLHTYLQYFETFEEIELFIVGIATDVCVFNTALDSIQEYFFKTTVIEDACVGVTPESTEAKIKEMKAAGIEFINTKDILGR